MSDFPDELKILLSLAEHNASHFSLRAAQAYVKNHRQALLLLPSEIGSGKPCTTRRSRCTVSQTTSHWGTCWKAANRTTNLSRGRET